MTHLDVARYSVAEYVKQLERDPETAERLGSEARRIHDTLLCPRCLAVFLVETFEAVSKHLGQSLVLDDGKVLEYDAPATLLAKRDGAFRKLAEETGDLMGLVAAAQR